MTPTSSQKAARGPFQTRHTSLGKRALQYRFKNAQSFGRTIRLAFFEVLVRPAHRIRHMRKTEDLRAGHTGKGVKSGGLHLDCEDAFRSRSLDRGGSFAKRRIGRPAGADAGFLTVTYSLP